MNRRTILTACGTALAGALAGCNSSDESTETRTATTAQTASPTPESTATSTPANPEVTAALETARPEAATAFEAVQSLQVVDDGDLAMDEDSGFRGYAAHERADVYDPLTVVRDTLVPVREEGSKRQQAHVELLLSVGEYTNTKYQEYTAIAEGFSRLYRGIDAHMSTQVRDAYEFYTGAREDLASMSQERVAASQLLQQFATDGIEANIDGFSIMNEQAEQTYVSTLVYRWEPAARGLIHQLDGFGALGQARTAFEADEYERSVRLARIAREKFDTAATAVPTALDRDVSLFSSWLETVACRAPGFVESAETLRAAGESALAGETHAASETYESSKTQFDRAFDCEGESA